MYTSIKLDCFKSSVMEQILRPTVFLPIPQKEDHVVLDCCRRVFTRLHDARQQFFHASLPERRLPVMGLCSGFAGELHVIEHPHKGRRIL